MFLTSIRMIFVIFVSIFTCQLVKLNATITYANKGCTGDIGNYTEGGLYQKNLHVLLNKLPSKATHVKFYNSSAGERPNKVYSIFQCREDLSLDVCTKCVANAAKDIVQKCPLYGEAVIWYEECMLRYANRSIFSLYEVLPSARQWSTNNISNYVEFSSVFTETMGGLINEITLSMPSVYFATKEANVTLYEKLYCLMQCTPDLNGHGCNNCLKAALILINNCCKGSMRAASFLPSCQVRYDTSPFYNQTKTDHLVSVPTPSTHQEKRPKLLMIAGLAVATSIGLGLLLVVLWFCLRRRKAVLTYKLHKVKDTLSEDTSLGNVEFVRYDFASLKNATEDFSKENKLGEGGFGVVYKGMLESGEEIAIKRLSANSGQGEKEFMTEAHIVAKLQHKNLVKLKGFCSEAEEKLLVYEFMPNTSLDRFLFDPSKQALLQWEARYNIIKGITRGLQYLHDDSCLTVVHRDLKVSNILLDKDMNPKIADFGLAKICGGDEEFGNTCRIAGTHGYMAPEYVLTGEYSNKTDVYSFGVIVLEIVSGRKNGQVSASSQFDNLLTNASRLWSEGRPLQLLDRALYDSCPPRNEVMRCIQIGLLCVQETPEKRPTMASVALMLTGSIDIPSPPAASISFHDIEIPMNGNNSSNDPANDQGKNGFCQLTDFNLEVEQDLYPSQFTI